MADEVREVCTSAGLSGVRSGLQSVLKRLRAKSEAFKAVFVGDVGSDQSSSGIRSENQPV